MSHSASTAQLQQAARRWARHYGVPQQLFLNQISQESGWNPHAQSPAGALGIAQIVPRWHPNVDPMKPRQALRYAAGLMASHYDRYGSWRDALSAYNSGRPWEQGRNISETYNYVNSIMGGLGKLPAGPGKGTGMSFAPKTVSVTVPDQKKIAALQLLSGATSFGQPGMNPALASALQGRATREQTFALPGWQKGGANVQGPNDVSLASLARLFGLNVTSAGRTEAENEAVGGSPTSFHLSNRAYDVSPGSGRFRQFIRYARQNPGLFAEFFFDPLNWYIKNGQIIKGAIGGHDDHLHYAI